MRPTLLIAVALFAACARGKPAEVVPTAILTGAGGQHASVPMRMVRHVPLVQLHIDGGEPVWFVLDTGAPISVIAKRIEPRIRRREAAVDVHVSGTTPGAFDTTAFVFDGLQLGELTLDGVDAIVTDLTSLDERVGVPLGGILGFAPFKDLLLTLDYPHARVIVDDAALPPPNGRDILPLTEHALHPSVMLSIAGANTITEVDSGSGFFMEVAKAIAQRLTFRAPPVVAAHAIGISGLAAQRAAKLDGDVQLGRQTLRAPLIFMSDDPSLDADAVARIGGPLLAHFAVSFDQRAQAIRFTRDESGPIDFGPLKTLGVELVKRGEGWQVVDFVPGTPAAALGASRDLRPGDQIIHVNGKLTADFDAADWELATYAAVPIQATVLRGDQQLDIVIPVGLLVP